MHRIASVEEVVNSIKVFVPTLEIEFVDSKIMNQLSYEVLNTRLEEKNFTFQGDLKQGIRNTIALLKESSPHKSKILDSK